MSHTVLNTKLNQHEIVPLKTDLGALGNRINSETRAQHDKIDKLMTLKLALALRDSKIYRQGLQSFYHVFNSIETALYNQFDNNPNGEWTEILKQVWKPELARSGKAQQDLMFYYDDVKAKFVNPKMPEQIKFAQHIERACAEKPYLLFAYLHVMYLALFAGGRVMRSSVTKATGLFPQKDGLSHEQIVKLGANFFTFDVSDEDTFRLIYKRDYELMTRNNLTESQKVEIIEEAKYIFEQNSNCVKELERYNLEKITKKWAYIITTRGYFVLLFILGLFCLYYVRRIILRFV